MPIGLHFLHPTNSLANCVLCCSSLLLFDSFRIVVLDKPSILMIENIRKNWEKLGKIFTLWNKYHEWYQDTQTNWYRYY